MPAGHSVYAILRCSRTHMSPRQRHKTPLSVKNVHLRRAARWYTGCSMRDGTVMYTPRADMYTACRHVHRVRTLAVPVHWPYPYRTLAVPLHWPYPYSRTPRSHGLRVLSWSPRALMVSACSHVSGVFSCFRVFTRLNGQNR